jgi:hypothetical protein
LVVHGAVVCARWRKPSEPGMIASETVLRDLDIADIRFKIEE